MCFILLGGDDGTEDSWTIWSDDSGSDWFADFALDELMTEIAWKHVDICGKCGSCSGGTNKTIFGRTFENVCRTVFRLDNPNVEEAECAKKLVELRKADIEKNYNTNRIVPLDRDIWQGYGLAFHYISQNYYDVEINRTDGRFDVSFVKKPFNAPFEHMPNDSDKLFAPWWDDIKAWGIEENGQLIAIIETAVEEWSNRLRVTELWIDDAYRRKGIGTALMDIAVQRAKNEKRRVIMLETQSRNEGAIEFYLNYGFTLIGFDACCYGNDDLNRKEVRMELGLFL